MRLRIILWLFLFDSCLSAIALGQNSLSDAPENVLFNDALELYQKEKYAAAQRKFNRYLALRPEGEKAILSDYYEAFCALHLQNPDFENRILRFVNKHPGHPKARQAYTDLGFFYFNQGNYASAVKYLEKNKLSQEKTDEDIEHSYKLAYAYFSTNAHAKARPLFDRIKNGEHQYALLSSYYAGYLAYLAGDYTQALTDLLKASTSPQLQEETDILIPSIYYAQEEYARVLAFAERIKSKYGNLPNGLTLIVGDCYFLNRRYSQAATYLGKYVKNTTGTISRDIYYRLGYAYYQSGQLLESSNYLSKSALGDDALAQTSSLYLGQARLKLDQKEEALIAFEQCRRMDYTPAIKERAAFFFVQTSFASSDFIACMEGCDFYMREIEDKTEAQKVQKLRTLSLLNTGDYQKALDSFDLIIEKDQDIKEAYQRIAFNKAVQDYGDGNYRNALNMLRKSLVYPIDTDLMHRANYWIGEIYSLGNKYDSALTFYHKVLPQFSDYDQLLYGMGYAMYNSKRYSLAMNAFTEFLRAKKVTTDRQQTINALTRLADCYYVTKQYSQALSLYNTVLQNQPKNTGYILYQKGMTYAAMNQFNEAVAEFERVIARPGSAYREAAFYQIGEIYFKKNRTAWAVNAYSQVIENYPEGKYILLAYSKRALANAQLSPDQSIFDYKQVIEKAPSSELASNAVSALIELSNQGITVPGIDEYMKQFEQQNPNSEIIIRGKYEKAKRPFLDGNYAVAIDSLTSYLQKYPNSSFRDDALYTLGYSFELTKQKEMAIPVYQAIKDPNFKIRASKNLADIYYEFNDLSRALEQYKELQQNAPNKSYWRNATLGLMRTYFESGDYEGSGLNAQLIIEDGYAKALTEARLYLGKVLHGQGNHMAAIAELQPIVGGNKNKFGAEAQYYIGKSLRGAKDYENSNAALIEVRKKFEGYPKWIYKAFLLLAENYADQGNLFQAEATLQSIIDFADAPSIRDRARQRLAELIAQEKGEK